MGGIGLFALGALIFLFFRRRHRRDLRRLARRTSIILEESYPTAVEPFVARPTPDNWQHHSNEKTYVGNSSSSLAVLPWTVMEEDSRTHSRAESTTTPDLATVARKVERIANILDTWTSPAPLARLKAICLWCVDHRCHGCGEFIYLQITACVAQGTNIIAQHQTDTSRCVAFRPLGPRTPRSLIHI